ncbi:MAG: hypothetical protein M5R40_25990 [Anaerolineae bacterium]|nr:hypothetical protein [Anaerolineae bacterium]
MDKALATRTDFDALVEAVTHAVASPRSARAYASDLNDWHDWCDEFGEDPAFPTHRTASAYLDRLSTAGASQRRCAAGWPPCGSSRRWRRSSTTPTRRARPR